MVDLQQISYENEFEELKCIGRGNFGAAFLVKAKNLPDGAEEIYFIAKKILLGQLSSKEQEGALLEANLLKNLTHPNIVAYKGSFIDKGILIIIMEFCSVGDLSFHIKKRRAKNDFLTETEIMNWFVQLCLSLEYVHGRKVLHRDIKSQNVFLTRNNTIKLGDFGISKVLENTNDQAMTVQGTPYYMSPEVCQNKPYTYKSDVWALGCVLYELCTLKHAFNAENLLGLVFKIVQDKQDPIPAQYSDDLKVLVSKLLNKNDQERPHVLDILKMPFVQAHMQKFVESQGKISLAPTLNVRKDLQPSQVIKDNNLQQKDVSTLTAKEIQRLKKEQRAREEFELMKQAAVEATQRSNQAKQRKQQEFHSSFNQSYAQGTIKSNTGGAMMQGTQGSNNSNNNGMSMSQSQFEDSLNNRTMQYTEKSNTGFQEDMQRVQQPITQYDKPFVQNKDYLQRPDYINLNPNNEGTLNSQFQNLNITGRSNDSLNLSVTGQSNPDFLGTFITLNEEDRQKYLKDNFNQNNKQNMMSPISEKDTVYEQTISSKGYDHKIQQVSTLQSKQQSTTDEEDDEYDDDFEDYEDDFEEEDEEDKQNENQKNQSQKSNTELNQVLDQYKRALDPSQFKTTFTESFKQGQTAQNSQPQQITPMQQRLDQNKRLISDKIGENLFNRVYQLIINHRLNGSDDKVIQGEIKNMVGKNREIQNYCFQIDQIVFMEITKF